MCLNCVRLSPPASSTINSPQRARPLVLEPVEPAGKLLGLADRGHLGVYLLGYNKSIVSVFMAPPLRLETENHPTNQTARASVTP
jgi:hypothetical protein